MTAVRGRGRPRDPETDAAILRAALDLFVEHGVEGTSMEQVAKRAGVGKLTVYRRWSSKEELIAQAVEQWVDAEVVPSAADVDALRPQDIIEHVLPAAARMTADPGFRALVARIMGSAVSHPSLMAVYWRRYILPRRELAAAMLRRAQQDGAVAPDADLDVIIDMMAGAVTYRVLRPDPPDSEEMLRYLTAVYRQAGLLPTR
ncbi:TetR/AcrR family transcriptional regulator [Spongiactinospora sp. TRM90649]|uniref:TetR/AcrR family transcriptional regulator n=1 Tax=Spongiactinospora sp. TRM90649 TaxID=3031114 RepID=UPI0023F7D7EA|nr:TetR/AcrR family transcriptional regulator [Spongiactinospora sp. TRM90649]MDF5755180.1 TetR/AcrR family transcriptional regulator [Spongiactinospora sp. TRM90649]